MLSISLLPIYLAYKIWSRGELLKIVSIRISIRFPKQGECILFDMWVNYIIFMALSPVSSDVAGLFLGANVAYLLITRKRIPDNTGSPTQRATRVFIALLLLGVSSLILDFWFKTAGTTNYFQFMLIGFLKTFTPASTIWVSVAVCTKLDLYRRDKVPKSGVSILT